MTTAIVITWTIGLLGALPATVVIVKESLLLDRTLRDTLRMAKLTAAASRGIGANVAAVPSLATAGEVLRPVDAVAGDLATTLEQLASRVRVVLR